MPTSGDQNSGDHLFCITTPLKNINDHSPPPPPPPYQENQASIYMI